VLRCSGVQGGPNRRRRPRSSQCRTAAGAVHGHWIVPVAGRALLPVYSLSLRRQTFLRSAPRPLAGGQESVAGKPGLWPLRLAKSTTGQTSRSTNDTRPVLDRGFRAASQRATGIPLRVTGNSRILRRPRQTTSESQILREGMIRERARRPRFTLHDLQSTTHNPRPRLTASPSPRFSVSHPPHPPTSHARGVPCNTGACRFVPLGEPDAPNPSSLP